jgi:Protein of unknown function (DUF3592)
MEKYFAAAFGLMLSSVGFYTCFTQLRNLSALNSWKIIRGKVVERGIVQSEIGKVRTPGPRFCPLVRYSYQVDGKDFTSDAIYPKHMLASPSGSNDWAEKEAKKFADEVTVFYNPENPADSSLKLPSKSIYYVVGVASAIVCLYSIFILIFGVDNWIGAFNNN